MFIDETVALFSESNSRFLCEVPATQAQAFEAQMRDLPCVRLGHVTGGLNVVVKNGSRLLVDLPWQDLKQTWLAPLDWE